MNRVSFDGEHFGFPYCEAYGFGDDNGQRQIRDGHNWTQSRFITQNGLTNNMNYTCDTFSEPIQAMGSHGVPMGMRFYNKYLISPFAPYKFPEQYIGSIFIASKGRGSTLSDGYPLARILNIQLNDTTNYNQIQDYNVFADGWQNASDPSDRKGRPQVFCFFRITISAHLTLHCRSNVDRMWRFYQMEVC